MITLVDPKEYIEELWGEQRIREEATYRMMRYVIRVDCKGQVLLHNVVTGRLVVLDHSEAEVFKKLPARFESSMKQLVEEYFLVPSEFDDRQQVKNLRSILLKVRDDSITDDIIGYTILPTTGCNARCYYCFEKDSKIMTMTQKTADEVVRFIVNHCGSSKQVSIMWFGGEPTLASNRINQISEGLLNAGITYRSTIITNGYLMDAQMVASAKKLWHLQSVQICVDGAGEKYNKIKAYVSPKNDPYETVMSNIGHMLDAGFKVVMRVNFDLGNVDEFDSLLQEVSQRYGQHKRLTVVSHPILGEHKNIDGVVLHGSDEWFDRTHAELIEKSIKSGMFRPKIPLPFLSLNTCAGYNKNAVAITPDGRLVKCSEQFGDDQTIGDIHTGIVNHELERAWQEIADYDSCARCEFYPHCLKLVHCNAKESCLRFSYLRSIAEKQIREIYSKKRSDRP